MHIFHCFNYYLPNFVVLYVWNSSLLSYFWIFVLISLNAIRNNLWNLCSWPEIKPWAFGVGALTPRLPENYKCWVVSHSENSHKGNHLNDQASPNHQQHPVHLNNKQSKNTNLITSRQDYHLTQSCPSEEKQTKTQHKSHPIQSLHKPLDQT